MLWNVCVVRNETSYNGVESVEARTESTLGSSLKNAANSSAVLRLYRHYKPTRVRSTANGVDMPPSSQANTEPETSELSDARFH